MENKKLNSEQIENINQALIKKGIKFDNIKIEVIDHIASEIECEMETNQRPFPEAFHQVFERWKPDFELTRAYFSLATYYPKLARNRFGSLVKLELIAAFTIMVILFISFQLISDSNARLLFVFWINKVFFYAYLGTIGLVLFFKFLNQKSKISSTYKYIFDKRSVSIFCWLVVVFNDKVPDSYLAQNIIVLLISFMFMFLISTIYLGFKHYQFQRQFFIQ
jgi:hypothetical protein